MEKEILRRLTHGFGANTYNLIVVMVIQLAGVPILLHAWGVQLYGEWLILAAIPVYLSMMDLGFSLSAANDMTARMGRGDTQGALAVFQSLAALVYGLAAAGLVLVAILVVFLPMGNWLHFTSLSASDIRWILWLLAADILLKISDGANHAGFRANGDYALYVGIAASALLLQNLSIWAVALIGFGPLGAAAAMLAVRAVEVPVAAAWMVQRHRNIRIGLSHASIRELRQLYKPALANIAVPLASALNIQGMILVIGMTLGPAAVVTFSVLRTVTRLALRVVQAVNDAFQPEFARAWGRQCVEDVQHMFVLSLRFSALLGIMMGIGLYFCGALVIALWTQGKVTFQPLLFDWLLLSSVLIVTWHGGLILLQAANQHMRLALWSVVSSGAAVLMAWVLLLVTKELWCVGVALVVTGMLLAGYAMRLATRMVGLTQISLYRRVIGLSQAFGSFI